MKNALIIILALLITACDPAPKPNNAKQNAATSYVLNPAMQASPLNKDSIVTLAATVGNPVSIQGKTVQFTKGESLFEIPVDSAKAWIKRPSFFRNPETKLAEYLKGDAPAVFTYDIYDPYFSTSVDSLELASYQLNFKLEDVADNSIQQGHASLRLRNQHTKPIIALEFLVNVQRRKSQRANCLIEPYTKTIKINHTLPPFSQSAFIHSSKALGVAIECNDRRMNEVPYKADFKLMRYQVEGDTSWVDATVRRVVR